MMSVHTCQVNSVCVLEQTRYYYKCYSQFSYVYDATRALSFVTDSRRRYYHYPTHAVQAAVLCGSTISENHSLNRISVKGVFGLKTSEGAVRLYRTTNAFRRLVNSLQ